MKLTDHTIAKLTFSKTGNQQDIRWDDAFPGFGVRIFESGRKTFVTKVYKNKRRRILTIGSTEAYTLDEARERAVEMRNPSQAPAPLSENPRKLTVNQLADVYTRRQANHMKAAKEELRRLEKDIRPNLGHLPVYEVTTEILEDLHARITKRGAGVQANRVVEQYQRMINRGIRWRLLPVDFFNPAREVVLNKEYSRERWITPDEMPQVLEQINRVPNPYTRALFWLYLLTGARKSELLTLLWSDYDPAYSQLRLGDTKNGGRYYISLSTPASKILDELERKPDTPYIFAGRKPGTHLKYPNKAWQGVREAAGVPDVTLHDLRRTLGSRLAQSGHSLALVGAALNHNDPDATRIYARFSHSPVRAALDDYAEHLMEQAGVSPDFPIGGK